MSKIYLFYNNNKFPQQSQHLYMGNRDILVERQYNIQRN